MAASIEKLKVQLCIAIERVASVRQWNQFMCACYCGTSQAQISRVFRRDVDKISVGALFGYLERACTHFSVVIAVDNSLLWRTPKSEYASTGKKPGAKNKRRMKSQ